MASLNPLFTIFRQVAEPAFFHQQLRGRSLRERVQHLLRAVRIPSPEWRMREYPHQMSGGMRQRIVGAIALAGGPRLVIADEPTTNLDVTIQAQYLDLLKDIQRETGVALIFVTHNLGIVAKMCDRVAVMYARQDHRAGAGPGAVRRSQAPVHARLARLGAEARQQGAALLDRRPAAESGKPALRDAPFIRAAPRSCHAARARSRGTFASATGASPVAGSSKARTKRERTVAEPVLEVRGLTKHFPARQRAARTRRHVGESRGRRRLRHLSRRDARPHRRVRVREDDHLQVDSAPGDTDRGDDRLRGPGHRRASGARS